MNKKNLYGEKITVNADDEIGDVEGMDDIENTNNISNEQEKPSSPSIDRKNIVSDQYFLTLHTFFGKFDIVSPLDRKDCFLKIVDSRKQFQNSNDPNAIFSFELAHDDGNSEQQNSVSKFFVSVSIFDVKAVSDTIYSFPENNVE